MDFSMTRDTSSFYDYVTNDTDDISLENIMESVQEFTSHQDLMTFKKGAMRHMSDFLSTPEDHHKYTREVPSFVSKDTDIEQTVIIDDELFFAVMTCNCDLINKFIRELESIPKDGIINLIIDFPFIDISYPIIDSATFIMNLIKRHSAKKVFNFGSEVGFIELMIATCCDDIYVSDFAVVSIHKGINTSKIPRFIAPIFKQFARFTYHYWMEKGLFTAEEISEFLVSESSGSINLLSHEIRERLK